MAKTVSIKFKDCLFRRHVFALSALNTNFHSHAALSLSIPIQAPDYSSATLIASRERDISISDSISSIMFVLHPFSISSARESIIVDSLAKTNSYNVNIKSCFSIFRHCFETSQRKRICLTSTYLDYICWYPLMEHLMRTRFQYSVSRIPYRPARFQLGILRSMPHHPVHICHSTMIDNSDDSCV